MTLGELKKSLGRFPVDMDDTEVLFTFLGDKEKIEYDNLAFVAYAEVKDDMTVVMLGSMKVALERMKKGTLHYADGTKPSDSGFDLSDLK
jgi:hypothetical protein